jgi:DNA repair protein RadC
MLTLARSALPQAAAPAPEDARCAALIEYLSSLVLAPPDHFERCHALFVDHRHRYLGDAPFGTGSFSTLSLRIREILGAGIRLGAHGMILAHNHPSGHCQPSGCDIAATRRLADVASALEIELIDHLIFTTSAVYSMRAGGLL